MARKKQSDSDRLYKLGGSDPRSGAERLAGVLNRGVSSRAVKTQNRRWDDSAATRARHEAATEADRKRRGVTSSKLKRRKP